MGNVNQKALEEILKSVMEKVPTEKLRVVESELKKLEEWKIARFNPHPKQDAFHRSRAHTRLFQGGNRSGKSTSGVLEAISFCLGYRPWYPKGDEAYRTWVKPPVKGRVVCEDFSVTAGEVLISKFHEWIPKSELDGEPRKNHLGFEVDWRFKNGSRFTIMTNMQDVKLFEAADIDFAYFDEPPPRDKYIATQRGLVDRGGYDWLCMTPLSQPWIYDDIVLKSQSDDDILFLEVDMRDNVGYGLTEENIVRFASKLREEEKEARIHGKFRHMSGIIYKDFDYSKHVIEPIIIPRNWPRMVLIDPHPRTPHMVSWFAVTPLQHLIQYDELFVHCTIRELVAKIKAKTGGDRIVMRLADPIAFIENPLDKKTWADEFAECGWPVEKAPKDLSRGIMAVKDKLVGTLGKPELYFFNTCKHTIWEIQRYRWDENKGNSGETKSPREVPVDKDDHAMENLYRACLSMPTWYDTEQYESTVLHMPVQDVP